MIVFNLKINKRQILKFSLIIMTIIVIIIGIITVYMMLKSAKEKEELFYGDCMPNTDIAIITDNNYTNVLKEVHENIDTYVGQKISYSGYVFRAQNFEKNQFVLARDMDIGNNQKLIVGFLSESEEIKNFENYAWISVIGEITKGTYNNTDIPILKVEEIKRIDIPESTTVQMPDNEFIPTAVIY